MVYARGRRTASGIFRTASLSRRFFPDSGTARASSMGDRTRDLRGDLLSLLSEKILSCFSGLMELSWNKLKFLLSSKNETEAIGSFFFF